jgi:hypothetical protein
MPLEEVTVSNMWEIAVELKLQYGVGSRDSARLRLGTDPSPALVLSEVEWIRMTMGGKMVTLPPLDPGPYTYKGGGGMLTRMAEGRRMPVFYLRG